MASRRLEVKIPAGARDGTRVRIAGEGSPGMGGGPRGDVYVVVKVRPHARFERKGDDLIEEVAVPVEDAVLGGEVEVQTIAGKRIAMKVPPLTQSGKSIKLKGLGMPSLDGKAQRRSCREGEAGDPGRDHGRRTRAVRAAARGAERTQGEGMRRNYYETSYEDEPCYVISVAARMVGMHAQSLRNYERVGLIRPSRSRGRVRLYSQSDIERLRNIQRMMQDLGVNLAGVEVIMNMKRDDGADGARDGAPARGAAGVPGPDAAGGAGEGISDAGTWWLERCVGHSAPPDSTTARVGDRWVAGHSERTNRQRKQRT